MNRRGGVRVRGGGFTCGRIGRVTGRKPYIRKNTATEAFMNSSNQQQPIFYRKPAMFQTNANNTATKPTSSQSHKNSGLKLVLKRASGNAYKVKAIDMNRPKREAAQKVKFVFSENENEDEDSPASPSKMIEYRYHGRDEDDSSSSSSSDSDDDEVQYVVQKPTSRRPSQQQQQIVNIPKQIKAASKKDVEFLHETKVINFTMDEIVPETVENKMLIACNQPKVKLIHNKPFPIALVEETTNVVYSKALLLDHLYQSYSSPCILCPLCKKFLSVAEFSKHIHANNMDEEDSKNKSFNILPYRTKNQITEHDMSTWKLFGKRYTEYKKDRLLKRERQRANQKITSKNRNKENDLDKADGQNKENQEYLKSIKLLNWNAVTKDKSLFYIDPELLENDRIVNLSTDGMPFNENSLNVNTNKNATASKKEDLVLSEDEEDEDGNDVPMTDAVAEKQQQQEHDLSENESMEDDVDDDDDVKIDLEDVTQIEEKYEKAIVPSIKNRYINFYDNLNHETLLYISDNQYTIIPTTYIDYIDHIRVKNTKNGIDSNNNPFI